MTDVCMGSDRGEVGTLLNVVLDDQLSAYRLDYYVCTPYIYVCKYETMTSNEAS